MTPRKRLATEMLQRQSTLGLIAKLRLRVTGPMTTTGRPKVNPNQRSSPSSLKAPGASKIKMYLQLYVGVGLPPIQANRYATTTILEAAMMLPLGSRAGADFICAALLSARTAETMGSRITRKTFTSESRPLRIALP